MGKIKENTYATILTAMYTHIHTLTHTCVCECVKPSFEMQPVLVVLVVSILSVTVPQDSSQLIWGQHVYNPTAMKTVGVSE